MVRVRNQQKKGPSIAAIFIGGSIALSLFFFASSISVNKYTGESSAINGIGSSGNVQKHPFIVDPLDPPVIESKETFATPAERISILDTSLEHKINGQGGPNYHVIFSTDCSAFQHWQSYLLFYSAYKVGQPGTVTRIASGCSDEDEVQVKEFQAGIAKHMSPNFRLHLTPHFSKVKDGEGNDTGTDYKFFNKPFGVLHWLENSVEKIADDDIVILLDPDQVFTRPITNNFSNSNNNLMVGTKPKTKVEQGSPFGQKYGFGTKWREFDLETITNSKDTPARQVNKQDAASYYPAGPPYLATKTDMHTIAKNWAEYVPKVHAEFPHLLAEMYAFSIAAAHAKLPFQIVTSLMVSESSSSRGEGWPLIMSIEDDKICSPTVMENEVLPSVLHYCQRYMVGKFFFGKRRMPKSIFTCESPLLAVPPMDIAKQYDYFVPPSPHRPAEEHRPIDSGRAKRDAFMICALTRLVNEASLFYQKNNCDSDKNTSLAIDLWSVKTIQVSS
jgi:hypothetical protein